MKGAPEAAAHVLAETGERRSLLTRSWLAPSDRFVPWLSLMPSGWEFKPLKYLLDINKRVLAEGTPNDFELQYVDISAVDAFGRFSAIETMLFKDAPSRARRLPQDGDVIISTVRTYLRAIAFVESPPDNLVCSTGFAVLTPGPLVEPKFLYYWVRCEFFVQEVVARSTGVSYPAINALELGSLPFPLLERRHQQAIVQVVDADLRRVDALIGGLPSEVPGDGALAHAVRRLQELRQAIITFSVTGYLNQEGEVE